MFKTKLLDLKLSYLLSEMPFKMVQPRNIKPALIKMLQIIRENKKTYIRIDEDCDGYHGGLILKKTFDMIGYKNYHIGRITKKTHKIDLDVCREIIDGEYDLVIIIDSSSNEMEIFNILKSYNKDVIVLDHHEMDYDYSDYPENTIIINPRGEGDVPYNEISGAFVGFIFCYWLLRQYNRHDMVYWGELFVLAYITLYSDSCNLSNKYNVSAIQAISKFANYIPTEVRNFMTHYDILSKNFVLFKYAPRINAQIRTGNFDTLHDYLYESQNNINKINKNYNKSKNLVKLLDEAVRKTMIRYKNFVVVNFDSLAPNILNEYHGILRNFTGLVANNLMSEFGCTALVYMTDREGYLGGSVREPFNRNVLRYFKSMTDCGGHPPAFGFQLKKNRKEYFLKYLDNMLGKTNYEYDSNIILDINYENEYRILADSYIMAEYNEYSGNNLPVALIRKQVTYDMVIERMPSYTKVKWKDRYISCFTDICYGDKMLIQPVKNINGIQFIVNVTT